MSSYRLGALVDVYHHGDACAVMVGDSVVVLSPVAASVVRMLQDREHTLDDLAAGLVGTHGAPPGEPREHTRALMDDLIAVELVVLVD